MKLYKLFKTQNPENHTHPFSGTYPLGQIMEWPPGISTIKSPLLNTHSFTQQTITLTHKVIANWDQNTSSPKKVVKLKGKQIKRYAYKSQQVVHSGLQNGSALWLWWTKTKIHLQYWCYKGFKQMPVITVSCIWVLTCHKKTYSNGFEKYMFHCQTSDIWWP